MIKTLGGFPRLAVGFGLVLLIAAGHVNTKAVAVNMIQGIFDRDVFTALNNGYYQLNFVVNVIGLGRVRELTTGRHQCIRWFLEKERRLAFIVSHFPNVSQIVATNAIDPAYRETLIGASHFDGCNWMWRDDKIHG